MKKGLNRSALGLGTTIEECIKIASDAGFDGLELSFKEGGGLPADSPSERVKEIRRIADDYGLALPSFTTGSMWKFPLTSPDTGIIEKSRDTIKKAIEVCSVLGADTLLVLPGVVTEDVPYEEAYDKGLRELSMLAGFAEKAEVSLGVENVANKMLLNPVEMRTFIEKIGNRYVGSYLDIGNTLPVGVPDDWIRTLKKHIKKVHVKDYSLATGKEVHLLEGDIKWDRVMRALKEAGYDGYITAELPPYSFCPEELAYSTSRKMDAIIRSFYK